ncbi:sensor histidine kinase [Geodermatophilus sp. TF02-6]|uniref:sensor histidine kinase n=1 Tax=Geodermatophilus sp. TF02-6 TaxID=2250575 RepID=UPI00131463E2|nr:sensor histidine kinase [Geodermatophilus sp. TF02-6]
MDRAAGEHRTPTAVPHPGSGHPASPRVRHGAAVVDGEAELLAAAVSFLEEGLRAGDLVALASPPETAELARAELGERVPVDPALSLLGARAPDVLARVRRSAEEAAAGRGGRLRILSQVDLGPYPAGWREGLRLESAANRFLGDAAVDVLCVYDRQRLPAEVVDHAARTHPLLVRDGAWSVSPAFRDPAAYLRELPWPREPVEDTAPVLAVDDAPGLAALRHALGAVLADRVPDREQREDLLLAAAEVAANAFRHGERPVSARIWTDGRRVVCAITDSGHTFADPLAGFQPAHGADLSRGGMGLWLARKLWDSVDLFPGPAGLTVRLSSRLR